jgi:hypothetical protein
MNIFRLRRDPSDLRLVWHAPSTSTVVMPLFTNLLGLFLNIHLITCSYIELAATVPAGKPVQASITQTKLYNGDTALINSMRVYLAAAATNSLGPDFFDSQCTFTLEHLHSKINC